MVKGNCKKFSNQIRLQKSLKLAYVNDVVCGKGGKISISVTLNIIKKAVGMRNNEDY